MPKNRKDRDEYHNNLNLAPVREPNALHLFTAGVKHKFDPSVPIPHRTHSHIALVTAFKGRAITSKTRATRRRVNEETIVGWSTFLALIKAHKKLQKGWLISKVVLYTTSQLIVKNLMSTNSKPLGSQLSIAVSLAFDAIATDFPEVNIEVRGFNKSWATAPVLTSMADYRDRPYPARPSRPSSLTGSVRSVASKSSTRSRLSGVINAAKTTIKSLGSPKPKRKNFIETGLEEHRERERTLFERADLEIVPTSQENEKELEELREERRALRRDDDDSDEEEVVEDSDEENNDAKAAAVPSQNESNLWNQFSTPPAELMTTPPLPSPLDASQTTYGFPTPSPALLDHPALKDTHTPPHNHEVLPDLDKTPTTPWVMQITEAEAYALRVRAANDKDAHVVTGANMTVDEFEVSVNKSKELVGEIVDEDIPASSPALPSKPWTFTEDQITGFRSNLSEILNSMARVTPRMATNPEAIAKELALF
ncbi:hypothetical protein AGABI1DRAFT_95616, partial [Agaricus bisporus var. burnettii JB137-S8]